MKTTQQSSPQPISPARRRGFSFTELMFAVMVLGLGFIMLAAMFPITIKQQQTTLGETISATTARGAFQLLQECDLIDQLQATGSDPNIPPPFMAVSERSPLAWQSVANMLINPQNPRIAFVPLYSRLEGTSVAQVYIIVAQCRNAPVYRNALNNGASYDAKPFRMTGADSKFVSNLEPRPLKVELIRGASIELPDVVVLEKSANNSDENYLPAAAEGGYLIIGDGGYTAGSIYHSMNGRIFKLGREITSGSGNSRRFELAPGGETDETLDKPMPNSVANMKGYVLGKGYTDLSKPSAGFSGVCQDIAIYKSFINITKKL